MASRSYTNASRSGFAFTKDTETSQPRFEAPENSSKMTSPYLLQSKKRKAVEYDGEDEFASALAQNPLAGNDEKARKKARKKKDPDEEKRSKRFRVGPPIGYLERLDRMTSQRMFLIDREKKISEDGTHEEEVFDLAGSTGNIYQVCSWLLLISCSFKKSCFGKCVAEGPCFAIASFIRLLTQPDHDWQGA